MIRRPIQDQNKKARAGPWGPALAFHYHKSDIGIEECCHAAPVRDAVISPCDYGQTRPGLRPFLGFAHPLRVLCRCSRRLRASTCHAAAAARRDIASPSPGRPSTTCGLPWALPCAPALSPCSARLRAINSNLPACSTGPKYGPPGLQQKNPPYDRNHREDFSFSKYRTMGRRLIPLSPEW